ncbi:MAG: hypothetical protein ABL986_06510 [Vicinamibacterales bacterium]
MNKGALFARLREPAVLLTMGPVLATGLVALYLLIETVRPWTLAARPPDTIAEAVAWGNAAQALEMMARGADVDAVSHVRPGLIDVVAFDVTPVEAAILSRQIEMTALLLRSGADPTRSRLAVCLARARFPQALPLLGQPESDLEGPVAHADEAVAACSGAQPPR